MNNVRKTKFEVNNVIANNNEKNNVCGPCLQHVNLSKSNNDLTEEKEKPEKKLIATDLSGKTDSGKTEPLRKEYDLKVAALDKCELHINKLQGELKDAREQAEQLQSAADSDSQVDNLRQELNEEIERTTQLKTALDSTTTYRKVRRK